MKKISLWLFKSRDENIRKEALKIKSWKKILISVGFLLTLGTTIVLAISRTEVDQITGLYTSSLGWILFASLWISIAMIFVGILSIIATNPEFFKEAFRLPYHLRKIVQKKNLFYKLWVIPLYLISLCLLILLLSKGINIGWQSILSNLGVDLFSAEKIIEETLPLKDLAAYPIYLVCFIIVIAIIMPILEEIFFRLFLLYALDSFWGRIVSVMLVAAGFSLMHIYSFVYVLLTIPIACILTWLMLRTGSLIPCILVHCSNNLLIVLIILYLK